MPEKAVAQRQVKQTPEQRKRQAETLTPFQQRFVEEYFVDFSPRNALIRAGSTSTKPDKMAWKVYAYPKVRAAIEARREALAQAAGIDRNKVLRELALLAFANMADYIKISTQGDPYLDFAGLTREQAAALVEMTVDDFVDARGGNKREVRRVKFRLADKRAALVDLGRHLNLFPNKTELSGPDGGPIPIAVERVIVDPHE